MDIISTTACFGQTQQESIVDFVYENAKITETISNQQTGSNVRRIRIPSFLTIKLSSDLLKNIPATQRPNSLLKKIKFIGGIHFSNASNSSIERKIHLSNVVW